MAIILPHKFIPRPYQTQIYDEFFLKGTRRFVSVEHRRAGKDKKWFNFMLCAAMKTVGTYYYLYPTIAQSKKALWYNYDKSGFRFLNHAHPQILAKPPNNSEMMMELVNGSRIFVTGALDIDRLMGSAPMGVVASEFSLHHPDLYNFLLPIFRENGGWFACNYTPRGHNHGYTMLENARENSKWYWEVNTVEDTCTWDGKRIISAEDIEEDRRSGTMTEEIIQQEYFCSFKSSMRGAYYTEQLERARKEGRICHLDVDASLPTYTFWDLGKKDATAIWFAQAWGQQIRFVDYYEMANKDMDTHLKYCNRWFQSYGIKHHYDYAPHDIITDWGVGRTRFEIAQRHEIRFNIVPKLPILEGISAARAIFSRCYFDKDKCRMGLRALSDYHAEYDERKKNLQRPPGSRLDLARG